MVSHDLTRDNKQAFLPRGVLGRTLSTKLLVTLGVPNQNPTASCSQKFKQKPYKTLFQNSFKPKETVLQEGRLTNCGLVPQRVLVWFANLRRLPSWFQRSSCRGSNRRRCLPSFYRLTGDTKSRLASLSGCDCVARKLKWKINLYP